MRVSPDSEHGYVVAEKLREGGGSVALACKPEHPTASGSQPSVPLTPRCRFS